MDLTPEIAHLEALSALSALVTERGKAHVAERTLYKEITAKMAECESLGIAQHRIARCVGMTQPAAGRRIAIYRDRKRPQSETGA